MRCWYTCLYVCYRCLPSRLATPPGFDVTHIHPEGKPCIVYEMDTRICVPYNCRNRIQLQVLLWYAILC